jgi:AbrB family looped-hinge helix DNA binding protein
MAGKRSQASGKFADRRREPDQGGGAMPIIKVLRTGQVTLPAELRRRYQLEEGVYLEATAVEGGILLRPIVIVDRSTAWQQVLAVVEEDKWAGKQPRPEPDAEERQIYKYAADVPPKDA